MLVGVQESVTYQRGPHYRGQSFWEIGAARLIVEVITPARSAVAGRLVIGEPLKCKPRSVRPHWIAGSLVEAYEAARQKAHPFARMLPRYAQDWTKVDGESPHSLLQHLAEELRLQGEGAQEASVQAIKGVVAAVVIVIQPASERYDRIVNLGF